MVTALIVVASVLACLGAYFGMGLRLALINREAMWERARAEWSIAEYARDSARGQFWAMIFFWPILLIHDIIRYRMDKVLAAGDPQEIARKATERERYIAQLEAENERLRRQQEGRLS